MEVPFSLQAFLLLKSIGVGVLLGVLYSGISILRLFTHHRSFMAVFLDFLFMLSAGLFTILFLVYHSDGQMRLFLLFGLAAGFLLFYWTLGALLRLMTRKICGWMKPKIQAWHRKNLQRRKKAAGKLKKGIKLSKNHLKDSGHMLYNQLKQRKFNLFGGSKRGKAYGQTAEEKNE